MEIVNATAVADLDLLRPCRGRPVRRRAARDVRVRGRPLPAPEPGQRVHRQLALAADDPGHRHARADRAAPGAWALRRPAAIIVGLVAIYTWTTLTYPTFTEPRYATALIMLTLLLVFVGLGQWPRRAQPVIIGALLFVVRRRRLVADRPGLAGDLGHHERRRRAIYDTAERDRGPDRMNINFATLNATVRINERLRRIYASDATLVAGDCNAMKFGEKLAAITDLRDAFDRGSPARGRSSASSRRISPPERPTARRRSRSCARPKRTRAASRCRSAGRRSSSSAEIATDSGRSSCRC